MSVGCSKLGLWSIMAKRGSVDPSKFPDEVFELYSIPAFDSKQPERVLGADIGSSKQVVQPGDVLLSKIVPHIRRAWVVGPQGKFRMIASGEWVVFRGEGVYPGYLRHILVCDWFHAELMKTVSGVGGSLLRARPAYIGKICIALPSLDEQRRIAAVLDKAESIRAKRQKAITQLDKLAQSIFVEIFGDLSSNSMGWKAGLSLGDVADIASGITKGRRLNGKPTREVPYLAVSNVQDMRLNLDVVKTIEATEDEIIRYALQPGDLLLTEGGDPDKLGRGTLWHGEISICIHQNHIFRVRVTSDQMIPCFLNWLIGGIYGKRYFLKSAKQTTGIASINMTQLRSFPLLLPPIEIQRKFEKALGCIGRQRARLLQAYRQTEDTFSSIQHRAFQGTL